MHNANAGLAVLRQEDGDEADSIEDAPLGQPHGLRLWGKHLSVGLASLAVIAMIFLASTGTDKGSGCGACPAGGNMVWNGAAFACVCEWCAKDSWPAVNLLCRNKCYTGADPMCAQCFPSGATVSVELPDGTVATRRMEQLRVGDSVLAQAGFSKIFAFMDHAAKAEAEYVMLKTAAGFELSMTSDHIVYAHSDQRPVLAGSIVEGNLLWISSVANASSGFATSPVTSVTRAVRRGMHAPLTEQGSVVVNGHLASSYAHVKTLQWGPHTLVSGHDLSKYIHEPLRLACSLVPDLCGPKWHSAEGRHAWTQFVLDHFSWLGAINYSHNDIRAALLDEPSLTSWVAAIVQLVAVSLLCLLFGSGGHLWVMCTIVAVQQAMSHRSVHRKSAQSM